MTPEWKLSVDAELERRGKTREWLATQIKTGKSTITQMLSDRQTASVHVDAVCAVLKIPHPAIGGPTGHVLEVAAIMKALTDEEQRAIVVVIRGMVKPRAPSED